ncbi:MAG: hypothetical protein JSU95_10805 [Betaproteobacteria bacterium]|nr:MAG: hypothetical protein JSU95_10805 [Betaproteobacteria bacterium]
MSRARLGIHDDQLEHQDSRLALSSIASSFSLATARAIATLFAGTYAIAGVCAYGLTATIRPNIAVIAVIADASRIHSARAEVVE